MSHIPQDAARRLVDRLSAQGGGVMSEHRKPCTCDGAGRGPGRECVVKRGQRLGELWRCSEGREPPDHTPAAAPSAPASAEVPMPEPDQTDVDCELWGQNAKVDVWYRESVLTYAAGREAAALERVRGVLRELVEARNEMRNACTFLEGEAADDRMWRAWAAARAELGEGR